MVAKIANIFTLIFAAIFLLLLFQTASNQDAGAALHVKSHHNFSNKFSGNAFAIDGDSLKVGGREVRLFGIDAPEYNQTCFDENRSQYRCGELSYRFAEKFIKQKDVVCYYSEKDKYNRYLSKCFANDVSINEELIKNGMAVIYNFSDEDENMERLESEAKAKRLGIWRGEFQLPKEYRKKHKR